jgi:hypothetical protein
LELLVGSNAISRSLDIPSNIKRYKRALVRGAISNKTVYKHRED